jgi:DNA-binding transcriptional ArsR family regulator
MKDLKELVNQARLKAEGKLLEEGNGMASDRAEGPRGVRIPNSTQVPNEILDEYLSVLSEAEIKCLLYLVRKTFGYNKLQGDSISLTQFQHGVKRKDGSVLDTGTGLSRPAITKALATLESLELIEVKKVINKEKRNLTSLYRLRIEELKRS